jgi:hypothetical protein
MSLIGIGKYQMMMGNPGKSPGKFIIKDFEYGYDSKRFKF